jgi:hypothetical protein
MGAHTARGCPDLSNVRNRHVLALRAGVSIKGKRRTAEVPETRSQGQNRHCRNASGNLRWRYVTMQSRLSKMARGGQARARSAENQARQSWANDFDALPADAKARFQLLHSPCVLPKGLERAGGADAACGGVRSSTHGPEQPDQASQSQPLDFGDELWPVPEAARTDAAAAWGPGAPVGWGVA